MGRTRTGRWVAWALALSIVSCAPDEGVQDTVAGSPPWVASSAPVVASTSASALPAAVAPPADGSASAPSATPCPTGMVRIEGGVFRMGAPYAVRPDSDYYLHDVALRSYCLDLHEVTASDYRACVEKGGCAAPFDNGFSCTWQQPEKADHPINCVDFARADQACKAFGKRLPTEEEWEYAARGGSEGRTYAWGEASPTMKLSCYNHRETCPVGAHPPGAFGLLGMTGNVWEWTSSPFVKHAGWKPLGEWRVYRGGSYSRRFPKWMKTWVRNRFRPNEWGAHLGFRCAADVAGTTCPAGSTPLPNDPTRCRLPGEKIPQAPAAAVSGPWVDDAPPPVITRAPSLDEDCQRYKPSTPVAYDIRGSSFAQRQHAKAMRGCANRDVGADFNSVCCPN